MARLGRKAAHHVTASGNVVEGLIHQRDGRWRILATGKRFTAGSEAEAIATFRRLTDGTVRDVPAAAIMEQDQGGAIWMRTKETPELWAWLREQILADQQAMAEKLALPGLARIDLTTAPKGRITLAQVRDIYAEKADANWRTKGQVKSAFRRLASSTGAETLDHLTTQKLIDFREQINKELAPSGAVQVFSKIKSALAFAAKYGMEAGQITAALGRMKVLYAPKNDTQHNPTPISPADFKKLLKVADQEWRAILLVSLNLALYLEDVCGLQWDNFDLTAGTYVGSRAKTKIVRVGALWPETVAALQSLPRRGASPYLLTSQTGTRFLATTKYDQFKELREAAGVDMPFSSIRDAAYTRACEACDDRVARVFAAHKMPGLMDSYIKRNPEFVRPAADAVHSAYGPF